MKILTEAIVITELYKEIKDVFLENNFGLGSGPIDFLTKKIVNKLIEYELKVKLPKQG